MPCNEIFCPFCKENGRQYGSVLCSDWMWDPLKCKNCGWKSDISRKRLIRIKAMRRPPKLVEVVPTLAITWTE